MAIRRWKRWLWLLAIPPAAYSGAIYWRIAAQAARDEARPADAIVVFGAAQYDGRPSPVYKARLDHAAADARRSTISRGSITRPSFIIADSQPW